MILVPVIPFILVLGVGYYYFTTSLESSTISSLKRIIEDHRQMIDSFLYERKTDLEFILNSYSYETLAEPLKLSDILNQLQGKSTAFVDLGLFNECGIALLGPSTEVFRLQQAGSDFMVSYIPTIRESKRPVFLFSQMANQARIHQANRIRKDNERFGVDIL